MNRRIRFLIPSQTAQAGFTLLELIVTTTIMLILVGGGITAYMSFNDRQTLVTSGKQLQTYIRAAQIKARAGERPAECDKLLGYRIRATAGTYQVRLLAVCEDVTNPLPTTCTNTSGSLYECLRSTYDLSQEVAFENSLNMTFTALQGGVTGAGTITLERNNQRYVFTVTEGGEIGEATIQ